MATSPSSDPTVNLLQSLGNVDFADQVDALEIGSPYIGNDTPGVWESYMVEYTYTTYTGRVVAPATVAGYPPAICQTFQPYIDCLCIFDMERIGGAPEIPLATDYTDWMLVEPPFVRKPNIDISANGFSVIYKTSGRIHWVYVGVNPDGTYNLPPSFDYPVPPWLNIDMNTFPDLIETPDEDLGTADTTTNVDMGD